ncbi:hypothetical protein NS7_03565, partial [Enterobacter hormaechei]
FTTAYWSTLLTSRQVHSPQKCRIIQQEYDTKTLKMFHFTINMFQFVNLKELLQSINSLKI